MLYEAFRLHTILNLVMNCYYLIRSCMTRNNKGIEPSKRVLCRSASVFLSYVD